MACESMRSVIKASKLAKQKTKGLPSEFDVRIGALVKQYRNRAGFSQEKLADALGITFQQIQKYENGVNRIAAGRLFEMSNILNMPVQSFFAGLGAAGLSDNLQESLVDHDTDNGLIELLKTYHRLSSPKKKETFVKEAKKVAEALA